MKERRIAVMFMDIVNFTTICERLREQNVVVSNILTAFFRENVHTLTSHGATIDKFIGDCIMCFWGAPLAIDYMCFRGNVCRPFCHLHHSAGW